MRVAIVHSFYRSEVPSGENAVVLDQVDELQQNGYDVALISRRTDTEIHRPGYKWRAALSASGIGGPDPSEELSAFDPDVVHVHNLFPNFGYGWLRRWGQRTVVTLHNYRSVCSNGLMWRDNHECNDCLVGSSLEAVKHKCYRNSRIATIPLAYASRQSGSHHPLLKYPAAKITLSHPGYELYRQFHGQTWRIPNFVREIKAPVAADQRGGFLYVGRLTPEKGVEGLVSDFGEEDENLTVVGAGPLEPVVRRAALEKPHIHYAGALPRDKVRELMARSRALVIPSLWSEGVPTVALEALSCGTPVVVSKYVAASPELTAEGAGIVYDPLSPVGLNQALHRVGTEQALFVKNARYLHGRQYAPNAWLSRIGEVYESL